MEGKKIAIVDIAFGAEKKRKLKKSSSLDQGDPRKTMNIITLRRQEKEGLGLKSQDGFRLVQTQEGRGQGILVLEFRRESFPKLCCRRKSSTRAGRCYSW